VSDEQTRALSQGCAMLMLIGLGVLGVAFVIWFLLWLF
jgi:hypothetical protein